jgi:cytochrome c peroxidase
MKSKLWISRAVLAGASAAILTAGCGGGGGGSADAAGQGPAISAALGGSNELNLDLSHLPDYGTPLPAYYDAAVAALDNAPAGVALSSHVATLGRVLFHDRRLSVNDTKSCASCHQQATDLADSGRFSVGFAGTDLTTAHSMRLANLRYWKPGSMFWDRRAASLEAQSVMPIQHPVEMGFDAAHGGIEALMAKMRSAPYYAALFSVAFGDSAITEERMQIALAQFMRSMVSVNSRWDSGYAQVFDPSLPDKGLSKPVPGLSEQEDRGRHLFMNLPSKGGLACATCHVPPTFALSATSGSNGLDEGETRIFKSPSLKNVGSSGAFMHDGRFSSLEQVVEHYASGVKDGPALDKNMRGPDGKPRVRNITPEDKAALVAFLKTLSDPVLAADPRFSDPFRR